MSLAVAAARTFDLVFMVLFISVLLTWVPNINRYNEPFKSIFRFSEIFFGPFRKIIPPIGMIDISPIIAFFALSILRGVVVGLLTSLGL